MSWLKKAGFPCHLNCQGKEKGLGKKRMNKGIVQLPVEDRLGSFREV